MLASAQIAIYPLRQARLSPAVQAVGDALRTAGLQPEMGPMSTLVTGEVERLFEALQAAFIRAATEGPVILTVTLSNACPIDTPRPA
jgi:uncharacterized protein YqgV (UPF0045/DUF77 family)